MTVTKLVRIFFLAFFMHFRERYSSSILSPHHFAFSHVCIKYDAAAMNKLPSRTRRTEMHHEGGEREGSRGGTGGGGGNDASANFRTNIALSLSFRLSRARIFRSSQR